MTIGERIAKCRKDKKLSQEYIAEILDVSRQAVSKWENDQSEPDTGNLIQLARLFGVSVEYLANGEEEKTKIVYVEKNIPVLKILGLILMGLGGISAILTIIVPYMLALGIVALYFGLLLILLKKDGLILGSIIIAFWTFLFILQGTIWGIDVPIMCMISVISVGLPSLIYASIKIIKKIKDDKLISKIFSNKKIRNRIIVCSFSSLVFISLVSILAVVINNNHQNRIEKERWFSSEKLSEFLIEDLPAPSIDCCINLNNEKILLNLDTLEYNDYLSSLYSYLLDKNFKHLGACGDVLEYNEKSTVYEFLTHDPYKWYHGKKYYGFELKDTIMDFKFIYSNSDTTLNGDTDFYIIYIYGVESSIANFNGKNFEYNYVLSIYKENINEGYKYRSYNITDELKHSSYYKIEYPNEAMKDKEVIIKVSTEIVNFSEVFSVMCNDEETECTFVGDNYFEFTFIMPEEEVIIDIISK